MARTSFQITLLLVFSVAFMTGALGDDKKSTRPGGHWDAPRKDMPRILTPQQREDMERLSALGYLDATEEAQTDQVVTIHDPKKTFDGVNLYVSGHNAEALLVDMNGALLHRWTYDPETHGKALLDEPHDPRWHMFHVYPNGDLIVLQHHEGLLKLDKDSKMLWARTPGSVHHDMDVMDSGELFVLTRSPEMMDWISDEKPIVNDTITELSAEGEVVRVVSILECIRNAGEEELLAELIGNVVRDYGDILHTNSIEIMDGRLAQTMPAFKRGRILLSIRHPNAIMLLDLEEEKLVWWHRGEFKNQHDASILSNGNLLIFDNNQHGKKSAIRELDVATGAERWVYWGSEEKPFYAFQSGRCQRLPNGNTLIVESTFGRVFEVTPEKEIVWEFWNPKRAGENNDFIARIYECVRYPQDYFGDWLAK